MFRIFRLSLVVTVAALAAAFLYGMHSGGVAPGITALTVCFILGVVEVSLSFDNAVVNAVILQKLSERWQRLFLTVGVLIATFGMRFILPLVVVWVTAGMAPWVALPLAFSPPANHAAHYADGSPSYQTALENAHPLIGAFGGMFLLLLFLNFIFEEREITWLSWLERPLAKAGKLDQAANIAAALILVLTVFTVVPAHSRVTVAIGGVLGALSFIVIDMLGSLFDVEEDDGTGKAVATLVGKAALVTFLYLEVLDASMSFDGVMGAFAITSDPVLIFLGLGFIGAMFVRSLTVLLVRRGTLAEYIYLEHGAMWAIGALSVIMLVSIGFHVNDVVTGLVGVTLIGAAFATSLVHKRRERQDQEEVDRILGDGAAAV